MAVDRRLQQQLGLVQGQQRELRPIVRLENLRKETVRNKNRPKTRVLDGRGDCFWVTPLAPSEHHLLCGLQATTYHLHYTHFFSHFSFSCCCCNGCNRSTSCFSIHQTWVGLSKLACIGPPRNSRDEVCGGSRRTDDGRTLVVERVIII